MEQWEWLSDFQGIYQVSNKGRLRSFHISRKRPLIPHYMKPKLDAKGYQTVLLRRDASHHMRKLHRMVAQAFIPNPTNLPIVNHIDGNKQNNHVSNLEWVTPKQNSKHAWENGLLKHPPLKRGKDNGMSRLTEENVKDIRRVTSPSAIHISLTALAKRYGVSKTTIRDVVSRRTWKHI